MLTAFHVTVLNPGLKPHGDVAAAPKISMFIFQQYGLGKFTPFVPHLLRPPIQA